MNLSSKNLFARYYNWIYGNLPKDLCTFFWGTLFAVLLSVLMIPGRLWGRSSFVVELVAGFVTWVLLIITIVSGNHLLDSFGYKFINLWGVIFGGLALGLLLDASLVAAVVLIVLCLTYIDGMRLPRINPTQNTKDFIGAIRGKYCTKINWK